MNSSPAKTEVKPTAQPGEPLKDSPNPATKDPLEESVAGEEDPGASLDQDPVEPIKPPSHKPA
jgi:hypothetical protein